MGAKSNITSFRDLVVWQEAHALTLLVYRSTETFPAHERFGLISQMRRAAMSVPANIVEGFRRRGVSDKLRFYNMAEGSLAELEYFIILAADLGYLDPGQGLSSQAQSVGKLLYRFIQSTQRRR